MLAAEKFYAIEDVVYCWRTSHKKVDWEANRCRLLREHLSGALEVLRLAEENGFDRMFYKIAKQAFKLVETMRRMTNVGETFGAIVSEISAAGCISVRRKILLRRYLLRREGFIERIRAIISLRAKSPSKNICQEGRR
jgi:hypothetical protein